MKFTALLIASASAAQLDVVGYSNGSIPIGTLMQNNPSHWRKVWPEGAVDNADGDADIINRFLYPVDPVKKKGGETYPYTISEDVLSTQASIKKGEKITGEELTAGGAASRGMNMISTYDNSGNVMEQDLPYGATWADYNPNMHYHGRA